MRHASFADPMSNVMQQQQRLSTAHLPTTLAPAHTEGPIGQREHPRCKEGSARRYPLHFCGTNNCCRKFSGEGELHATDLEHLPVCHHSCWKQEQARIRQEAALKHDRKVLDSKLPTCHRSCYMQALRQSQGIPHAGREVVPLNRGLLESLNVISARHRKAMLERLDEAGSPVITIAETLLGSPESRTPHVSTTFRACNNTGPNRSFEARLPSRRQHLMDGVLSETVPWIMGLFSFG